MTSQDLCDLDAVTLRQMIGRKEISPRELVDACIRRVEAVDPTVNALVSRCFDRARMEAAEAEAAVMGGGPLGLLHGLPIGIKDLSDAGGVRTTYGSELFADHVPAEDERVVAAVRRAGAIVLGKTNTPEFGTGANTRNAVFGATRNPFDSARTCGGSSGGSAVALACGMVPLATGSDHGGSLRTPAAFCGITGYRPSPGMVPSDRRGMAWSPSSVDGPMGRTVADAALLMSAMAGTDPRDPLPGCADPSAFLNLPEVDTASLRVAVSEDLGFAPVDDGIRATFRAAVGRMSGAFGSVAEEGPDLAGIDTVFEILRSVIFVGSHREKFEKHRDALGPNVIANMEAALRLDIRDIAWAMSEQTRYFNRFVTFMEGADVLICPAVAVPPFPVEQWYPETINGAPTRNYMHWLAITYGLTVLSHPVVVVPCGLDATGTPFGIQICGRYGADRAVLGVARAIERLLAGIPGLERPVPDLAKTP
ncbi:amidase [Skermanella pratensis]|uniref:amidase n=1 Tax=Skermanella pratensis TaxID=2233999 RepID=UPI0013011F31|nr:amidase family protein [Skermanella pratensis]